MYLKSIRKSIGAFFKKSLFLQNLYNSFYLFKNKRAFICEVEKRKQFNIFACDELIKPLPFCPFEKIKDSNYYGYVHALKLYLGDENIPLNIEHGLYLDHDVSYFSGYKTFNSICTFSEYRLNILKEHGVNKRILAIGPYIHYSKSLLGVDELNEIKNNLGKVLLYMPSHSTNFDNGTSPFFHDEVDYVAEFQKQHSFDTVIVCLYYRDFQYKDCVDYYVSKGFLLTTAGHQLDLYFVSRLRSIIELADYTMSNQIGTNTGFCIYLNKPHIIINDFEGKYNVNRSGYHARREIADAFLSYNEIITEEQLSVVNKYWGLDQIKSKEELLAFLKK